MLNDKEEKMIVIKMVVLFAKYRKTNLREMKIFEKLYRIFSSTFMHLKSIIVPLVSEGITER